MYKGFALELLWYFYDASNIDEIYTKFSAFDPPFGGVIITRKQKFLSSFQLWHSTSLPTTTLPTDYEANRLTSHFQVLHLFLRQSLLNSLPLVHLS